MRRTEFPRGMEAEIQAQIPGLDHVISEYSVVRELQDILQRMEKERIFEVVQLTC